MKLYYAPGACSLADHVALIEIGLPFETEKVDLKTKRTETGADFISINPKGYVPALELDDGQILTENIAVLSYIADKGGKLMPANSMPHWRVLETTAFVSTELHKNFKPFFSPGADNARKEEAKSALEQRFELLERQLGDRAFIVGEDMTIADCYLFVMLMWATEKVGISLPTHLAGYYARLKERPAVKKALRDEGLG
jgi:glutathione S-transferase